MAVRSFRWKAPIVMSLVLGGALVLAPGVPPVPRAQSPLFVNVGCMWQVTPTPNRNPDSMSSVLRDVAVVSADDAWAIGAAFVPEEGGRGRTLILRWDGSRWRAVRHPQGRYDVLMAVAGSTPSDVWAVGSSERPEGLVLHWDGLRWRRVPAVDPGTKFWHFTDVVAIGPNDVWAVGVTVSNGVGATLTEHWDGTRWSIVPSPNPPPPAGRATSAGLTSVAASSSSDVWAVGSWSIGCPSAFCIGDILHTLTERWDGMTWTIVPSPDTPGTARTVDELESVSAASLTDAWTVGLVTNEAGFGGRNDRQLLEKWDGSTWSVVSGAERTGTSRLFGVIAMSSGEAWAVGSTGAGFTRAWIERWNGVSWSPTSLPVQGRTSWLAGAAAGTSGEVWAVGSIGYRRQRTLALRCRPERALTPRGGPSSDRAATRC